MGYAAFGRRRWRILLPRASRERWHEIRTRGEGLLSDGWIKQPELHWNIQQTAGGAVAVNEAAHSIRAVTGGQSQSSGGVCNLFAKLDDHLLPRKTRYF